MLKNKYQCSLQLSLYALIFLYFFEVVIVMHDHALYALIPIL